MAGGVYGSGGMDPFEEFIARFFGAGTPRRPVERVNLARFMSEHAREAVREAAMRASEWGSRNLDTDHLLWAVTRQEPTRQLLSRAGADPEALARQVEETTRHGPARQTPPQLTPSAKRALLDAHQISRASDSSYIGPEHLLLALALNPESAAGRILHGARITPESLQSAAAGGPPAGGASAAPPSSTPTLDEFGRDLTALAREGRIDDLIDQAGARVTLRTKTPGQDVRALERRLEQRRREKDQAVAEESYETAAALRDEIGELERRAAAASEDGGSGVPEVTAADIAEVVSRITGIPASQLTQEEKERLLRLEEHLRERVIGQDEAAGTARQPRGAAGEQEVMVRGRDVDPAVPEHRTVGRQGAGRGPARPRTWWSARPPVGGMCRTTDRLAGRSPGSRASRRCRAPSPPAEAAITTTSRPCGVLITRSCPFGHF